MTRDEAKSVLFDMLGKGIYVKDTKENQAILAALRALEQEPCGKDINVPATDAISRQAVLNILDDMVKDYIKENDFDKAQGVAWVKVQKLTSVSSSENPNKWIPVSERLPEDIKPVIVTWKNTDPKSYYQYIVGKHFIGTAHYKSGKWYWYSSVTEDLLAEYGKCDSEEFDEAIEVVAWMPLPEPYKAESEDKE